MDRCVQGEALNRQVLKIIVRSVKVAEIYHSIQGEGFLTGTESVFVRTSGCNLRCWFCDTPYTSWEPEGKDLSVAEIVAMVEKWTTSHVVITGGEPMLFAEMLPLCDALSDLGRHLTIETAGTLYLPVRCDLMSVSPKLANSSPDESLHPKWYVRHDLSRHVPDVIRRLAHEYRCQFKFVVETQADVDEVERYLDEMTGIQRSSVMLMPQGVDPDRLAEIGSWLSDYCGKNCLHFCPRRQIEWFGMTRGT